MKAFVSVRSHSAARRDEFLDTGRVLLRGLLTSAAVDILEAVTDDDAGLPVVRYPDGREVPSKFVAWISADVRRVALDRRVAGAASELLGASHVQLLYDEFIIKEPAEPATPWHQDLPFWPLTGTQVVSIWIALDRVDGSNGGVQYVEGSHRWGRTFRPTNQGANGYWDDQPGEPVSDFDAPPSDWTIGSFELEAGDAVAHAGLTLHGSGRNASGQRRRGYVVRWIGPDIRYDPRNKTMELPFVEGLRRGDRLDPVCHPIVTP